MFDDSTAVQRESDKDDARILKSNLSQIWTGPSEALRVGPSESEPHRKPAGDKFLYLDFPSLN